MADLGDLERRIIERRRGGGSFIVGVTGGVAAGKSTLAAELRSRLAADLPGQRVELAGTDGFLRDNATLASLGLTVRKGFPESYDIAALDAALAGVRRGRTRFPGYSHDLYDVDPALTRSLDRPDILLIEGLGFTAATPVDLLVFIDAHSTDLEAWYLDRFLRLWRAGQNKPRSFYARFAGMSLAEVTAFAAGVWAGINRPNIEANILPLREVADIVVHKAADHRIARIAERETRAADRRGVAKEPRPA